MILNDYIFRNDIAFFIVEEMDDDFTYCFTNEFYSKLMEFEYPMKQKYKASQLMNNEDFIEFKTHCLMLNKDHNCIKYVKNYIKNRYHMPLTITLNSFVLNDCNYIACSAISSELYFYYYPLNNKNKSLTSLYNDSLSSLFTIQFSNSHQCVIEDYNEAFSSYIGIQNKDVRQSDIRTVFPKEVSNFLTHSFIHCLREGCAISKQILYNCTSYDKENYKCPESGYFYLNVTFAPINHYDTFSCLCSAKDITNKIIMKRKNEETLLEYETLFNSTLDAIAILKVSKFDTIKLESQNKRMEVFLNRFPHMIPQLFSEHDNFKSIIREKSRIETTLTFDVHGETYHIQVSVVPVIKNAQVIKIIVTILNISSEVINNNRIDVHLTRREKEIVAFASQGQKNDYIAKKLGISTGTVKKTLSNVYKKLSITSRVELIKFYLNEQK